MLACWGIESEEGGDLGTGTQLQGARETVDRNTLGQLQVLTVTGFLCDPWAGLVVLRSWLTPVCKRCCCLKISYGRDLPHRNDSALLSGASCTGQPVVTFTSTLLGRLLLVFLFSLSQKRG